MPWGLVAFGFPGAEAATRLADRLAALAAPCAFSSIVLIGRETEGVQLRAAAVVAPDAAMLAGDAALGLDGADVIRYDDAPRGIGRRIAVRDGRLAAVRLCGEGAATAAAAWLRDWMLGGEPVERIRRALLAPTSTAPVRTMAASRVVCIVLGVSERAIRDARPAPPPASDDALRVLQSRGLRHELRLLHTRSEAVARRHCAKRRRHELRGDDQAGGTRTRRRAARDP